MDLCELTYFFTSLKNMLTGCLEVISSWAASLAVVSPTVVELSSVMAGAGGEHGAGELGPDWRGEQDTADTGDTADTAGAMLGLGLGPRQGAAHRSCVSSRIFARVRGHRSHYPAPALHSPPGRSWREKLKQ